MCTVFLGGHYENHKNSCMLFGGPNALLGEICTLLGGN